ncbi:Pls/PosA family non-ribosomal peptide synthetase [Streptomyces avicenniae]|uniref:Pls/PosA family non-ribosomal peptide synthetase n=1 Tax=Streptomyces avicenniae TaxID=500153 RepID=UPI000A9EF275|nr:Pls/PosA family non-ribosomal peptide synthetase [Streptomyces avicenniae]
MSVESAQPIPHDVPGAGTSLAPPSAPHHPSAPAPPPRTLLDILRATATAWPDALALDDGATPPLTYRGLTDEAHRLATRLRAAGIGPGDRVGVHAASGTSGLYTAVLGILGAGAAYVPVDADDPPERAALVWREAAVHTVVGDGHRLTRRPGVPATGRGGAPGPGDDAWIIFTSGSTGTPKGVAVTHRSAAAFADAEARLFVPGAPLGPGDRVMAGLSVAFDASCEEMWLAWRHGACLVPAPRALVRSGAELGPWLAGRGITVVSTVPTLALLWPPEALAGVRLLILGGEPCPPEVARRFARDGREVWNTYGPTEATVVTCAARLTPGGPVRIGLPLDGWETAVLDPRGLPVAPGGIGELVIGGVGLARYLDPLKDAERFAELPALGWSRAYRTGDLVRADPEGLTFIGRADDQVKIGGRRVELGEIDAALLDLPGVTTALSAVRRTPGGVDILVGYVVPGAPETPQGTDGADGHGIDLPLARRLLRERLPAPLVPRLVVLPALPTRVSGKADRAALPWPPPGGQPDEDGGDPGPATAGDATTAWLLGLWTDLLGATPAPGDNFFDLGGTSVAAARLVTALRTRHPRLSVADLYRHPTPAGLRALLDGDGDGGGEPDGGDRDTPTPPAAPPAPPRPRHRHSRAERATATVQFAAQPLLHALTGARWLLTLTLAGTALAALGHPGLLPTAPWWFLVLTWPLLGTLPGRAVLAAASARLLCHGLTPGTHPRGGHRHLRLWAAERLADALALTALTGTPLARWYARLLGCRVGPRAALHALPPVTGLAHLGADCAVEPEADLTGWWLDGDTLRVGTVHVGPGARVGARAVLQPGAHLGAHAEALPGACVTGHVPDGARWSGSPAAPHPGGPTPHDAPALVPTPQRAAARAWALIRLLSPAFLALLTWSAVAPAVLLALALPVGGLAALPARAAVLVALGSLGHALLVTLTVRLLARALRPGDHPADSAAGWASWLTHSILTVSRQTLFPLYASLFTPVWFRLLGARVGRDTELSTVVTLPSLLRVGPGAFLADHVLAAPYELRGGRVHLGVTRIGAKAFIGNSGHAAPGRVIGDGALVAVLADAPPEVPAGSSWLGNPPIPLRRTAERTDPARTFSPGPRLRAARAAVELCRVLPVLLDATLRLCVSYTLLLVWDAAGPLYALLLSGPLLCVTGLLAGALTTAAKWLLMGRFVPGRHPLWSPFVWRNELYDTFVEVLAVPWLVRPALGTPLLTWWLRGLGARIGRRVWCETHWLPEPDLVRIGDGAVVGRGCVVQTHLFHDRVMRLDTVDLAPGAVLGPHGIALPGSRVGEDTHVAPLSLVMAAEHLPDGARWQGNPVRPQEG